MKKMCLFFIIVVMLFTTSCSMSVSNVLNFADNDSKEAKERFEQLYKAINSKNADEFKKLFAVNSISEDEFFDEDMYELFELCQGELIECDNWGGPVVEETREVDGHEMVKEQSTFDVKTSEEEYRFALEEYTKDTADANNIGIHSLYVIKAEDDIDRQYAYWGDGNWTPGITIGKREDGSVS